jgi:5-methylcytosine-specific restriction protein B
MTLDRSHLARKRAEFTRLFQEFADTYLASPEGQQHVASYAEARVQARVNMDAITEAEARGEDVTEAVLSRLLPYTDTEANRAEDRWIHPTPALSIDVRVKFEAAGWTPSEAWPQVARAILWWVRRCVGDPAALAEACQDFAALPYTKGLQTATLSPILNALRPGDFALINNPSRRVVNEFAGTEHGPRLTAYPAANATARALIHTLSSTLHDVMQRVGDSVHRPRDADLFDIFCHWLVALRQKDEAKPSFMTMSASEPPASVLPPQTADSLVVPLDRIFTGWEEAVWAFEFLQETLQRLGVEGPEDERFALTLRHNARVLRLNFGNWAVLQFYGPSYARYRVGLALLDAEVEASETLDQGEPFATEDGVGIRVYELPLELVQPWTQDSARGDAAHPLRRAYERSFAYIAARFQDWHASNYRRFNQPQIAEAVFDLEKREALFAQGLEPVAVQELAPATVQEDEARYTVEMPRLNPVYSLIQCAENTGFDVTLLERWVRAIERKGQAILYGPPGTGKTYIAEHLARHLIGGSDGFVELVQFHPAYAYEDFIQGIRPRPRKDGGLVYPLVPGRFLTFCERARAREGPCVLIIDEINRANLSRVFGELMYVLEYRDRQVPLAAGGTLCVPANVRMLGTLNTADRSIALVDHALRRRFAFLALYPNYDVLRRYHADTGFSVDGLIQVLRQVNAQIGDPHYYLGVTFFLHKALGTMLEDIWRMEIEPYLEEYFFDQPEKAKAFAWERIAGQVMPDA